MKDEIKNILINLGANVCGIANIERFTDAPKNFHPRDLYHECKSVIVFAKALPKGIAKVDPRIIYQHFNNIVLMELDIIAPKAALEIERKFNGIVVPIPADSPYEYWNAEKKEGRGILSMKHAAVLAGLGRLGKNSLLMNHKYGNMLNIGAMLTNLDLESDPIAKEMCIKGCHLCLDNCPVNALKIDSVDQLLCRNYTYENNKRGFEVTNCNKCRMVCPKAFG